MPVWIPWRKHWNLYPDGKIEELIPQAGKGLRNFFVQFITKKCANAQKIGMDIELV